MKIKPKRLPLLQGRGNIDFLARGLPDRSILHLSTSGQPGFGCHAVQPPPPFLEPFRIIPFSPIVLIILVPSGPYCDILGVLCLFIHVGSLWLNLWDLSVTSLGCFLGGVAFFGQFRSNCRVLTLHECEQRFSNVFLPLCIFSHCIFFAKPHTAPR